MTASEPHRVAWFAPDRPVEGNTVYVRPDAEGGGEPGVGRASCAHTPDGCGCQYDAAGRMFRTRCICPPEPTPEQTLRAVAGLGGGIGEAVRDLLAERDDLRARVSAPRVWLPGDTVPAGVWVTDDHGDDEPPFRFERDTTIDPVAGDTLVEVLVPAGESLAAAVAAERARRDTGEAR